MPGVCRWDVPAQPDGERRSEMAITTIATGLAGCHRQPRATPTTEVSSSSSSRGIGPQDRSRDRDDRHSSARGSPSWRTSRSRPTASTYYLSERGGTIYAVDASRRRSIRPAATVLASGLGAVHQLAVDGRRHRRSTRSSSHASGSLLRIDIATGTVTTVASGGFSRRSAWRSAAGESIAYVTEQASGGRILAVPTAGGAPTVGRRRASPHRSS